MFPGLYALVIVGSFAGMMTIDKRWGLALFHDAPRTAAASLSATLALFIWDLAAIHQDIFRLGDSPALLNVEVSRHFPVEEIGFILFLPYCSLVVYRGVCRLADALRARRGGRHVGAGREGEGAR